MACEWTTNSSSISYLLAPPPLPHSHLRRRRRRLRRYCARFSYPRDPPPGHASLRAQPHGYALLRGPLLPPSLLTGPHRDSLAPSRTAWSAFPVSIYTVMAWILSMLLRGVVVNRWTEFSDTAGGGSADSGGGTYNTLWAMYLPVCRQTVGFRVRLNRGNSNHFLSCTPLQQQ